MLTKCIVCAKETPAQPTHAVTRWGPRKYCSTKCIKTAYRLADKDRAKAQADKWLLANPEKRKEASANYQKRNKAYYAAYSSNYSRRRAKQSLELNEFEELWMTELYDLASLRGMEVDHITPLKHDKVCGLHVPWNMQLLTRSQNAKKNNTFNIE